ncbi:MAG TPA: hypothetical protein VF796_29070 [Humisphaera sp.]
MAAQPSEKLIHGLLRKYVASFPEMRTQREAVQAEFETARGKKSRKPVVEPPPEYRVDPPVRSGRVPTFDKRHAQPLSPMLRARYSFASDVVAGLYHWPSLAALTKVLRGPHLTGAHRSMREHWTGSAPNWLDDRFLSVLRVCPDVPETITYLAWVPGRVEPKVWLCQGMDSELFEDLAAYLKYVLE